MPVMPTTLPPVSPYVEWGLVEELATLDTRKHCSFASKFARFFIDMERFPIYDSYAVKMVAYHLGMQGQIRDSAHPYRAFIENIHRLKSYAQLSCTTRELDHYFWLGGLYRAWLRNPRVLMNAEVKELFDLLSSETPAELADLLPKVDSLQQLQSETSAELDALLPSILDKAFKGEL